MTSQMRQSKVTSSRGNRNVIVTPAVIEQRNNFTERGKTIFVTHILKDSFLRSRKNKYKHRTSMITRECLELNLMYLCC